MELVELKRMFVYNSWANRETVAARPSTGSSPPRGLMVMAHIVGAERLWLNRLRGAPADMPVWPNLDPEQCAAELERLHVEWEAFLDDLDSAALSRPVSYVNSRGEPWTNSVEDVLMHVVLHSSYHRGQIAASMREAGHDPAYTDFIHAVRRGLIE
jgi:uncharacterized damage-inducible protein DinB